MITYEEFFNTEFGSQMKLDIGVWDRCNEMLRTAGMFEKVGLEKAVIEYEHKFEIYQLAMKQFCGIDAEIVMTEECYGLRNRDDGSWLFRNQKH